MRKSLIHDKMDYSHSLEPDEENRLLSQHSAQRVLDEAISYAGKQGEISIVISSWWGGGQRWAKNSPTMTADQREIAVIVQRGINRGYGVSETNQLDSVSLKGAIEIAEHYALKGKNVNVTLDKATDIAQWNFEGSNVWSESTYTSSVAGNAKAVSEIVHKATQDKLVSAGYIGNTASTALVYSRDDWGRESTDWGGVTFANCSVTVRHPKGLGSGWSGQSSYDAGRWNVGNIASLAYEKCKLSLNPVRFEPGRYTTILEPQAVAMLMDYFVRSLVRINPESGKKSNPIYSGFESDLKRHISKIGLKLVDDRVNIYHDPKDPIVGTHRSKTIRRVDLIKNGILTEGYNSIDHEIAELYNNNPAIERMSYRVDGGDMNIVDMIKSTRRGLLVARLDQIIGLDVPSLLLTGVTRDGLWLIENGAITKAIRNFRWTESPLFAFNNIEDIGVPESVYNIDWRRAPLSKNFHDSLNNVVVPAMKIKDFNFSSMIDAI